MTIMFYLLTSLFMDDRDWFLLYVFYAVVDFCILFWLIGV